MLGGFGLLLLATAAAWVPAAAQDFKSDQARAQILVRKGRVAEAIVIYRSLLARDPGNVRVARDFGGALRRVGEYEAALVVYEHTDALLPQPRFLLDRVGLLTLLGRTVEALDLCVAFLDRAPSIQKYLQERLIELADDENLRNRATDALEKAFDDTPSDRVGSALSELYLMDEKYDDAIETTWRVDRHVGADGERAYRLAHRLHGLEETDRALDLVTVVVEDYPGSGYADVAHLYRSELQVALGRADEAYAALTLLGTDGRQHRNTYEIQMRRAELLSGPLGRIDDAVALYDTLLADRRLRGRHENVRLEKADIQLRIGRFDGALSEFRQLSAMARTESVRERSRFLVGELFFYMGEIDSAAASYAELLDEFPEGNLANDALERIFLFNENFEGAGEALKSFARLVRIEASGDVAPALALGDSLIVLYRGAPIHDDLLSKMATLAASSDAPARAIGYVDSLTALYPESRMASRGLRLKGSVQEELIGDPKAALGTYETLLINYPDSIDAAEVRPRVTRLRRELRS